MRERRIEIGVTHRDARLPIEIWAPADRAPGGRPLVVYSHSSYGGRRQAAELLGHLASHGYVAAAPDHVGNLLADFARPATGASLEARVAAMIAPRVPDLVATISAILRRAGAGELPLIDPNKIAVIGWSFGGWAALATPEVDARVAAVAAMVPGGASNPLPGIIPSVLTFAWQRSVGTLVLAADRDQFTPLDRVAEVFERAPQPKRGFVLHGADHDQFADEPETDGVTRAAARAFRDSLVLAHLDATLRHDTRAEAWLARAAITDLAARGVDASELGST